MGLMPRWSHAYGTTEEQMLAQISPDKCWAGEGRELRSAQMCRRTLKGGSSANPVIEFQFRSAWTWPAAHWLRRQDASAQLRQAGSAIRGALQQLDLVY